MWLLAGLVSGAVVTWIGWRRRPPEPPTARAFDAQPTLQAWVDTLLPAEGDAPGAVALGVPAHIAAAAASSAPMSGLLMQGLAWADEQARSLGAAGFAGASAELRARVVAIAEASPPGSVPLTFFQSTLDDTVYHHYGDPRSWPALGYDGPPQPRGFTDHTRAPAR